MQKISVIIPCYNVEKYIDYCVESIIRQTIGFEMIQLILVDDKSTDNTIIHLSAWEEKYPDSILVIACEVNRKQGAARNIGIDYAVGEYIFFLDADDFIEADTLEEMTVAAQKSGADVVKIKYGNDRGDGYGFCVSPYERNDAFLEYNPAEGSSYLNASQVGNNGPVVGAAGSLYRKEFIDISGIRFPEELMYEDNYWNSVSCIYLHKLYIVDRCLYHYRINEQSTINRRNNIGVLDKLVTETMIIEKYQETGYFDKYCDSLFLQFLQRACLNLIYVIFCRFDAIPIDLNEIKEVLWSIFEKYRCRINIENYSGPYSEKLILYFLISEKYFTKEMQESLKQEYLRLMSK